MATQQLFEIPGVGGTVGWALTRGALESGGPSAPHSIQTATGFVVPKHDTPVDYTAHDSSCVQAQGAKVQVTEGPEGGR